MAEAHYNLGLAYVRRSMIDEAIGAFKRTVEIDPSLADAHNNLGAGYYYKGEYGLAIEHCDMAIRLGCIVRPELLKALKPYREK